MDDVFEHEELVEGNLEPIGDGSVGMDDVDQSVELRCAREGGQLVNRRKVESRNGFPGEASEMETVGIQETRNQNIRVGTGPAFKTDRETKAVDLGEETGEEIEEKLRRWMKAEKGMSLYVICEGRRLSWGDLADRENGIMRNCKNFFR